MDNDFPKLYLKTPKNPDYNTFPKQLSVVLDSFEIACLRIEFNTRNDLKKERLAEILRKICNERDTICLWEHSGEVGSILNSEQKGTINIQSILSNKMDIYEDRTKRIELAYNKDALKKIRELTKMNISDLRNNAGDNGLSIESDGKFLNKQDLIDNMLEKYIESGFN